MINTQINELVAYGLKCGLVSKDDQIFVTNQLLKLPTPKQGFAP